MAPKTSQFGKKEFDEYMGEVDDDDDEDVQSVGSDDAPTFNFGSSRPSSGLGLLGGKPSSGFGGLGGLGAQTSKTASVSGSRPGSTMGILGGLGASSGTMGGLGASSSTMGRLGGLGAPNSRPSSAMGGLGKLGLHKIDTGKLDVPASMQRSTPKAEGATGLDVKYIIDTMQKLSNLQLEVLSSNKKTVEETLKTMKNMQDENVKALKSITTFMQELSENTLNGYREVSKILNQHPDEQLNVQQAIEEHITSIDEEIYKNMSDQAYLVIPGSDDSTVTYEEATKLLADKTIHIYGSVRSLASAKPQQVHEEKTDAAQSKDTLDYEQKAE